MGDVVCRGCGNTGGEAVTRRPCGCDFGKAVAAERERCAGAVNKLVASIVASAKEQDNQGDALRKLVEADGALLALAAIRQGGVS